MTFGIWPAVWPLYGSRVMNACVVYGASSPVTITLGQHAYAECPSTYERRRWLSASTVDAMDARVGIDCLDSSTLLLQAFLFANRTCTSLLDFYVVRPTKGGMLHSYPWRARPHKCLGSTQTLASKKYDRGFVTAQVQNCKVSKQWLRSLLVMYSPLQAFGLQTCPQGIDLVSGRKTSTRQWCASDDSSELEPGWPWAKR